jgi:2-polyprenyl-3-methyl-5-hydroxy-6-metoxy-1,4-benzoquinol methylase
MIVLKKGKRFVYITTKDYLKSKEEFQLLFDPDKHMLITSPQPNQDVLGSYYDEESYISHSDSKKGIIPFLYYKIKRIAIRKKIRLIKGLLGRTGTLLDIGTGTGDFIFSAKEQGWNVSGIEPNVKAREQALKKGLDIEESLDNHRSKKVDVITLWHVLEHVPDLKGTINRVESMLKPGGILIIAVPNFRSFDAKHYKQYWAAYDVPRHLWHFSRESMKKLFSKNLTLISLLPMIFDSFYVSLLSEKYKRNRMAVPKAFFIGLWSNISAWRNREYSSLIYCYKKQV